MKKMIKCLGITAAALLAVAPVTMPVISSATATTVKADRVGDDGQPNGTYTDNGDGTYTLNGSFPVSKDGQVVTIPLNNIKVTTDSQGTVAIDAPEIEGYAPNYQYLELGLRNGSFFVLAGADKYTKKATNDTSKAGIVYHTIFYSTGNTLLYTEKGNVIKNRALGTNSIWASDRKMVLNGETYYRVATTEWAKANDGFEVSMTNAVIKLKNDTEVYNSKGQVISNEVLPAGTVWKVDMQVNDLANQTMYRVGSNQWVGVKNVTFR